MQLELKLRHVETDIIAACEAAGRSPQDVQLIAVSKTRPVEHIQAAKVAGQVHFGENYAQELRDKAKVLPPSASQRWHYIGRIQRNKAKYIAPNAYRIHTLENEDQVEALLKRAPNGIDGLLAVNIGREPQKSGLAPEQLLATAQQLATYEGCRIRGLMCLPPKVEHAAETAPYFEEMKHWFERGRDAGFQWTELSMGMSADYVQAITYGATWIRVGTAIFGPRT